MGFHHLRLTLSHIVIPSGFSIALGHPALDGVFFRDERQGFLLLQRNTKSVQGPTGLIRLSSGIDQ